MLTGNSLATNGAPQVIGNKIKKENHVLQTQATHFMSSALYILEMFCNKILKMNNGIDVVNCLSEESHSKYGLLFTG